jgi:hypothetical protein
MAKQSVPSITYWNRVEPSPRSDSLVRGLQAAVRDPLWFLARQWQMGEFRGEDAASPAFVRFAARFSSFESWRAGNRPFQPLDGSSPLEALVESEAATPDWRTSVALGQALERILKRNGASSAAAAAFRAKFPVPQPADLPLSDSRDGALARLLRVCGSRAIDGQAARVAAAAVAPAIPPGVNVPDGDKGATETALGQWLKWADAALGAVALSDAPAWRPGTLDYDAEVVAATPAGTRDQLRAHAGPWGEFDWFSFDVQRGVTIAGAPQTSEIRTSLLPSAVKFSGMPNNRWWEFEDARYNWASLDADRREVAKALVLDFMLVQGNDWYMVPFGQPVGSLMRVEQLLVHDVFGGLTLVPRADAASGASGRAAGRWTLFSTSLEGGGLADYFILPPSALRSTLDGPTLEEVRFLRDEQANMVWAVETTIENGVGRPSSGRERALGVPPPPSLTTGEPLRYQLQTTVPVNWIPFVPVQIDAQRRSVALERAAMERVVDGALTTIRPIGRVLNPTNLADPAVYRINEEEVERSGTRVLRAVRRTRWIDGSIHVWSSRRRRLGFGEGASGLRFDLAIPSSPTPTGPAAPVPP